MDAKVIPVKVAVRCRPLVEKELSEGCQTCLQFVPGEPQVITGKDKAFTFDFVFEPNTEQQRVYQEAVIPLVSGLFKGYNATVLAYGQTGSGKTFTMGGGYGISLETDEEVVGVIPRVIRDLFSGIKEREESFEFSIKVSYLEIYKEDLMDLFVHPAKRDKDQITIRDDVSGGIKLVGMTELEVRSFEETMKLLEEGSQGRTTGSTAMNHHSSRSHAIFTIHLERKNKKDSHDFCKVKFHLVDLAGSERMKKTHAEGERLKEGININRGLLSLGNVISALGEEVAKRGHIPYRDSKLTRLLQDSLGGNSHTVMIACVSPADSNMEETISALRYADRARKIKNKPVINRDPQAAEILRLRQLVQELQCQGLALGKPLFGAAEMSSRDETVDYKSLLERCKKLEEEKQKMMSELQTFIGQNTDMMEKIVRLELARDRLKAQMQDLKQKTGLSITQLMNASRPDTEEGETQTSHVEPHISLLKEIQEKILEIEAEDVEQLEGDTEEADTSLQESALTKEMRNKHVLRQAKLGRELQELNSMLQKKQELASQMLLNDEQLQEVRHQYERQMKEMETEIEKLQKEKEDISQVLQSVKANAVNNKLAEQRRKRMQELENQIGQLKRKMTEQSRMLKIKEQTDKQVEKLNQEILMMKQQRVKLMNQIKDDAEQFRKMKADMAKEVLQLKTQDRKKQVVIAKLEREKLNQQAVMRRRAEAAAAVASRFKELLQRQKMVGDERLKKQEMASMSGIGARIRKILGDEFDFMVSMEEAKLHLDRQMSVRKDLMEQLHQVRAKLEGAPAKKNASVRSAEITDDEKQAFVKKVKELDQQIDLCNAQIADLQQILIEADQDEKCKSRWDNIHTMVEAKCAMKWLLDTAVCAKVESDKKDCDIEDIKASLEEVSKALELAEEEHQRTKQVFQKDLHAVRKEQESKILYLLNQLRNSNSSKLGDIPDDELRKRIAFQDDEIARLAHLEEELSTAAKESDHLRKESTKAQYNSTFNRDSSLMRSNSDSLRIRGSQGDVSKATVDCDPEKDSKFFSPAFFAKQSRKRTMGPIKKPLLKGSDESSSEEDDSNSGEDLSQDTDWEKGLTPGFDLPKHKSRTRVSEGCCRCKSGSCITKCCACYKMAHACNETCGCKASDKCQNILPSNPLLGASAEDVNKLSIESSMNRTFTCEASQLRAANCTEEPAFVDTNQDAGTCKRSSGAKKKTEISRKEGTLIVPQDQNHDPLPDGLSGFAKKRKLQPNQSGYFIDQKL